MFRITSPLKLGIACLLAIGSPSFAADDLPDYPLPRLQPPCVAECADFKPAEPILRAEPEYRSDLLGNTATYAPEGFALLRYTVGTDGRTHDIIPIFRIGHHRIAEQAMETIKTWTFTPATRNGKPVAQMLTYRIYLRPDLSKIGTTYSLSPFNPFYQPPPVNLVEVDRLMAEGKRDEARALLKEGMVRPHPSDYQSHSLLDRLLRLATERGDYLEARQYSVMATVANNLPSRYFGLVFWTARMSADLALGELADASFSFQRLRAYGVDAGAEERFREAFAKADAAPELLVRATIPSDNQAPVYWHALHRKTFKFAEGAGALDKFSLMCDHNMMEGQVSFTSQWRLPATWRNCILFVSGAPGATFGVIETKDG